MKNILYKKSEGYGLALLLLVQRFLCFIGVCPVNCISSGQLFTVVDCGRERRTFVASHHRPPHYLAASSWLWLSAVFHLTFMEWIMTINGERNMLQFVRLLVYFSPPLYSELLDRGWPRHDWFTRTRQAIRRFVYNLFFLLHTIPTWMSWSSRIWRDPVLGVLVK